jgi:hypothetical protein
MSTKAEKVLQEIQSKVEKAMNSVEVARLTPSEYESVERLRQELDAACLAGDKEAARRAEELIFAIIKEGPPAR